MTVSIILPVFNAAPYLAQCLESLLAQTYRDIEIVAVDDGSSDASPAILRAFAARDARLRVFAQENGGPARARSRALCAARGAYLMFCDADDWYAPAMCARMVAEAEAADADLVMCAAAIHEETHGAMTENQRQYAANPYPGRRAVDDALREGLHVVLWNKLFRASLVRRFRMTFPDGYEHDDLSFIHQYISAARTYSGLSEALYHHRLRAGSVMDVFYRGGAPEKRLDLLYAFGHTGRFLRENDLWTARRAWFLRSFQAALFYLWPFLRGGERARAVEAAARILAALEDDARAGPRVLAWLGAGHLRRARLYLDGLHAVYRAFGGIADGLLPRGSRRRQLVRRWL